MIGTPVGLNFCPVTGGQTDAEHSEAEFFSFETSVLTQIYGNKYYMEKIYQSCQQLLHAKVSSPSLYCSKLCKI